MKPLPTKINVILGCDPLLGPSTGIAHYTRALAVEFTHHPLVDLKLFAHGAFFSPEKLLEQGVSAESSNKIPLLKKARSWLATQSTAISFYKKAVPTIEAWRLKPYKRSSLFHSPNFIVPRFDGSLVSTFHDLSTLLMPECHPPARVAFLNEKMQEAVQSGAHIITCSSLVKNEVCNYYGLPATKVDVVPLAADECFKQRTPQETFANLAVLGLTYGKFFLFVSTIEPRKNLLRQLRAFARYWQIVKEPLPLVIVGGQGWNSDAEHKLIRELALKGAVHYLGFTSAAVITALYSSARALLFVSRYEGFGLPLLEAMQSGCPVITSIDSAMAGISNGAALLVDYQDEIAICNAVIELAENDVRHSTLKLQGLGVASAYKWSNTATQTVAVYQRLLS